jgi:hypothetical protein
LANVALFLNDLANKELIEQERPSLRGGGTAVKIYSDSSEGMALILMQIIEEAENKDGHRQRSNRSEKERLLSLYKDCLSAVTGTEREALHTLH